VAWLCFALKIYVFGEHELKDFGECFTPNIRVNFEYISDDVRE